MSNNKCQDQEFCVSTTLLNSSSQISQQVEDLETRRKAFMKELWGDVTLFDMISDRGGAVSDNNSNPASAPISYVWITDYFVDNEQTFTLAAKKLYYTDYFKGAGLNRYLNNDFKPYYQVPAGQGGGDRF